MKNDFNAIAPFYDRLAGLIFGRQIKKVQIESLQYITPQSTILIAGGGTGWLLEEITRVIPRGLDITYIDKSSKMIELSQKRNVGFNTARFINDALENIVLPQEKYDVILTPFFLDCFSLQTLSSVFNKLDSTLKTNGLWINVDFYVSRKNILWQKMLVKLMYLFFRLTSRIEAMQLPDMDSCFIAYKAVVQKMYCHHFIRLQVLQKNN